MASNGKKEYTLVINGISQNITGVTKLRDALEEFNKTAQTVNTTTVNATKSTKEKAKALTEEEKAAKKLEETEKKIKVAQEGLNDAQIKANKALKEATREQALRIQAEQASTNSIEAMRVELSRLKDEWKGMDVGTEEFRAMSEEIRVLNDRIKEAEQSTGDFRRNVGNYGSALEGLGKLSEGVEGATKTSMGLAQSLLGANMLMTMFGDQSEESAKQAAELQKILALLSIIEQVNTNIVKEGIIQNKLGIVVDGVRTAQIKAKTAAEALSTKGTVAATLAQRVFNMVASANPYVLLALALVTVVGALWAFASGTDKAAEKQKQLNERQKEYLDSLDREASRAESVSNERIASYQRQMKVLEAQGGKQKEVRNLENQINTERKRFSDEQKKRYDDDYKNVEKNRVTLIRYELAFKRLQKLQEEGVEDVTWDVNLDGKVEKYDIEKAKELAQEQIDKYGGKVQFGTSIRTNDAEIDADIKAQAAKEQKERIDRAKEAAQAEREAIRAAQDAKIQLIQNADEQARQRTELTYDRQIEDLKRRLSTEGNLTGKARAAINEQITSLEAKKGQDLDKLKKEQADRTVELEQRVNASITAIMVEGLDKRLAQINLNYDQQVKALEKEAAKEENQTAETQAKITQLIQNAQDARANELQAATAEDAQKRADLELSAVDDMLAKIEQKISKATVREKDGLKLIDVEATRKNLTEANKLLGDYIADVEAYKASETAAHELALSSLKKGTPEYEAEVQKYSRAMEDATRKITAAQDKQKENTEDWKNTVGDALRDLLGNIAKIADAAAQAVTAVTDTLSMSLGYEIEALNKQLDALDERYEEAKKQREDDAENVEDIEARLREATGGTAEALKSQLQDALKARQESAREEQKLARDKEKLEAQIARKEKEQKRAELVGNISQAIANTAAAVVKVLPNYVLAGIIGATGLAQVGIMTQQLTKLEKGGEIKGPSHANGGVPIPGTNYEVEGGEFVINKRSYGANPELVRFINDSPRALTVADLTGFLPGEAAAPVILSASESGEDRIIQAIQGIDFSPKVAVTDIIDATDKVTTVQDIAGF